jgi:glycosyltransferase involved in cell wall biosynthesis
LQAPLFTVFTPTYNRAHTIHRVFDSLGAQTLRDFEWVVVDDGSTDGTEELVTEWIKISDFPIRYFKQAHSGKHVAHNLALREARGKFFLPLDSDDACVPLALERMSYHWETIPDCDRAHYSGVAGLCSNQHGDLIGQRFPTEPFDATLRERRYVYRLRGEKWGSLLTEIARRFPFPEIRGTQFTPEGVVWLDVAKTYKDRCVNEVFRIYFIDDSSTGVTITGRKGLDDSAPGRLHYYVWLLNNDLEYFFHSPFPFLKAAVMLPIVARFSGKSLREVLRSLEKLSAKALVLLLLPAATLLYAFDRIGALFRSSITAHGMIWGSAKSPLAKFVRMSIHAFMNLVSHRAEND